ncbi:MAG: triphosphoribosyl-dephospho-CoA synthase [Anaerolineales bacterium]|nr:triphosphoribosyl-dephospho-CoA synthase [Anaerolineales bacterium]
MKPWPVSSQLKTDIPSSPGDWTPDIVAAAAQLACLLEVSAEKPGNVTPTHAFHDMNYEDFLRGAVALGPEMARAGYRSVGATILAAITARRRWTQANTNLGIVLLFAPLARAALTGSGALRDRLRAVLRHLTLDDARAAYAAIRLASAGGLAAEVEHDVRAEPTITLREAMASAAHRDSIAAEYGSDYAITFERGLPALQSALAQGASAGQAVVQTYLELLAAVPDTLIARKRGLEVAQAVSAEAARVLAAGGVFSREGQRAIAELDAHLRVAKDNSLNPGTTADLVAATLLVGLLEGVIQ